MLHICTCEHYLYIFIYITYLGKHWEDWCEVGTLRNEIKCHKVLHNGFIITMNQMTVCQWCGWVVWGWVACDSGVVCCCIYYFTMIIYTMGTIYTIYTIHTIWAQHGHTTHTKYTIMGTNTHTPSLFPDLMASIMPNLMFSSTWVISPKSNTAKRPSGVRIRLPERRICCF